MKNIIKPLLLIAVIAMFSVKNSFAQSERATSSTYISIGPDAGIPIGAMHHRYDWNLGGSVQVDVPLSGKSLYFVGNAGFNNFFAKDGAANPQDLQMLPLKAGLKYFAAGNFYVQGQAGASFLFNKEKGGYDKSAAFTYAPQVGYQFPAGANYIDAGIRWEGNSKFNTGGGWNNFLGLRVAYGFGL
ncbi:hypothetical protein D0C36_19595 [Mucilaginibacter conchicola]|uniref:Outer membrane protein beta-barrel domain-containing protein n=1 Tax=Mucilaginibacter conchicola TaxID=2303333 RepID=A0A372NQL6_9SPHI|nr:hypothetical protein [Mucilaginibacter conchicola]RFZ91148.1 hypothetical protein D0C36_19595 [Mucilaginibacter conchicola]